MTNLISPNSEWSGIIRNVFTCIWLVRNKQDFHFDKETMKNLLGRLSRGSRKEEKVIVRNNSPFDDGDHSQSSTPTQRNPLQALDVSPADPFKNDVVEKKSILADDGSTNNDNTGQEKRDKSTTITNDEQLSSEGSDEEEKIRKKRRKEEAKKKIAEEAAAKKKRADASAARRKQNNEKNGEEKQKSSTSASDGKEIPYKTVIETYKHVHVGSIDRKSTNKPALMKSVVTNYDSLPSELKDLFEKSFKEKKQEIPDYNDIFDEAGNEPGLRIWRMIQMTPHEIDKADFGKFCSRDCYIVLYSHEAQDKDERPKNIYCWFGKESDVYKKLICINVGNFLLEKLTYSKLDCEDEEKESEPFRRYFNHTFKPFFGDYFDATLSSLSAKKVDSKLVKISLDPRLNNKPIAKRVPFHRDCLTKDGAFVITTEGNLFVWCGSSSTLQQRLKASDTVNNIKHEEKRGNADVIFIVEGDEEPPEFRQAFLANQKKLTKEELQTVLSDPDDPILHSVLKVDKSMRFAKVEPPLTVKSMKTNQVYVLETRFEVFVWYGTGSAESERRYGDALAQKIAKLKPLGGYISSCWGGFETTLFLERMDEEVFPMETREIFYKRKKEMTNIMREYTKKNIDIVYDEDTPLAEESLLVPSDDSKRYAQDQDMVEKQLQQIKKASYETIEVWKVKERQDFEPMPKHLVGHFWSKDCYLIKYVAHYTALDKNVLDKLKRGDVDEEVEEEEEEASKVTKKKKKKSGSVQNRHGGDSDSEDRRDNVKKKIEASKGKTADEDDYEEEPDNEEGEEEATEEQDEVKKRKKKQDMKKMKSLLSRKILFCWEGSESLKLPSLHLLKNCFTKHEEMEVIDEHNQFSKVVQKQFREGKDFLTIFENQLTFHSGSSDNYSQKEFKKKPHLYRVYILNKLNCRLVEVDCKKVSLNSNDCFLLIGSQEKLKFFWMGSFCSKEKRELALLRMQQEKMTDFKPVKEAQEPEDFWESMVSESGDYEQEKLNYRTGEIFECFLNSKGQYRVMKIGEMRNSRFFADDFAHTHYTMIFMFDEMSFIWYPTDIPTKRERRNAQEAMKFLLKGDEDYEEDEEDQAPEFEEVYAGKENRRFKSIFPQWYNRVKYKDYVQTNIERRMQQHSETVQKAYPFLDIMRKRYHHLLTDDENANVYNIVFLYKKAQKAKDFVALQTSLEKFQTEKFKFSEEFMAELFTFVLKEKQKQKKDDDDAGDEEEE